MMMLLLVALGCFATGCLGGTDSDELITRAQVTSAFAAAKEPIVLKLDMAKAAPQSRIDALYSARREFEDAAGPFEVVVLEDEDFAISHAARLERRYARDIQVARNRNVVLIVVSRVGADRRMRLIDILQSL